MSRPQAGVRGTDGKKKVRDIKRYVLTCSRGFVLPALVTAANVHDTQATGWLLDRAAQAGWAPKRAKMEGIYTGARMDEAAARHGLDVQTSLRELDARDFHPLPLHWRIRPPSARSPGATVASPGIGSTAQQPPKMPSASPTATGFCAPTTAPKTARRSQTGSNRTGTHRLGTR